MQLNGKEFSGISILCLSKTHKHVLLSVIIHLCCHLVMHEILLNLLQTLMFFSVLVYYIICKSFVNKI